MNLRPLGCSDLTLSDVGYGGWEAGGGQTWGANPSSGAVVAAVHAAADAGMNWVDTAEVYGNGGGSEAMLGEAIGNRPGVAVCTKVAPAPDGSGLLPTALAGAAQASLRRLRRDVLDLYYLHWPDPAIPVDSTWEAMSGLVQRGLVRHIGLSNFTWPEIERCHRIHPVTCVQLQASVLYREELETIGACCRAAGIGVVAYGALAFGLLAGTLATRPAFADWRGGQIGQDDFFVRDNYQRFFAPEPYRRYFATVASLRALAARAGCSVAQLAIAWLLQHEVAPFVLAGTRNRVHARENAAAAGLELERDLRRAVDAQQ